MGIFATLFDTEKSLQSSYNSLLSQEITLLDLLAVTP
jgi:hypothetical protein